MHEQLIRRLTFLATAEDATGMHDSALAMREAANALASVAPASPSVDAEKVMALVQEFGEQCEAAGYLDRSGSQDAAKRLHDAAYQTAVKIRALLSASPAGVGGWMPIETAPKDGTEILAWKSHAVIPIIVRFDAQYEEFEDEHRTHIYHLTHWQPLPSPPAIANQGEGEE